jgi:GNAT superfamily N-acetyltransferase
MPVSSHISVLRPAIGATPSRSAHSWRPSIATATTSSAITPSPTPGDVQALVAAFARRDRTPRLEYLAATAPAVEAALLAAGFVVENRLPLMTITLDAMRDLPVPQGVELALAIEDADLLAAAQVQNSAYGEPETTEHDVARLRSTVANSGIIALARDKATGAAIGAGLCTAPHDGTAEIAAIGTLPAYRRRGVAGAIGSRLLREAIATGVTTPFLMTEHEAEARIYARLGFVATAEIVLLTHAEDKATAR